MCGNIRGRGARRSMNSRPGSQNGQDTLPSRVLWRQRQRRKRPASVRVTVQTSATRPSAMMMMILPHGTEKVAATLACVLSVCEIHEVEIFVFTVSPPRCVLVLCSYRSGPMFGVRTTLPRRAVTRSSRAAFSAPVPAHVLSSARAAAATSVLQASLQPALQHFYHLSCLQWLIYSTTTPTPTALCVSRGRNVAVCGRRTT